MFKSVWSRYQYYLQKRPLLTQCVTIGSLYGVGDICAQYIEASTVVRQWRESKHIPNDPPDGTKTPHLVAVEERTSSIDIARVFRLSSFGFLVDTPILHLWYSWLERRLPGATLQIAVKKLFLDQFLCAPFVYFLFFPYLGMLKHQSISEIKDKVKQDYLRTYLADCILWIPANLINFLYVSPRFRIAYIGVVSLGWSIYLAFIGA